MNEEEKHSILSKINSPADLRGMSVAELEELASEIRSRIIEVVSVNGGHLASSLGVVELTIALHYVYNTPHDKLVWDVGHQGYVHKLLTGRQEAFSTLRRYEGCLGFLSRAESEYDCFGAGHAGTAISAALGMAAARDRKGGNEKILAVVGDGSLNCGISLEGLNNVSETTRDFIIILNDNKMSISQNVGAIPKYLNRLISGKSYNRFKALGKMMLRKIPGGEEIHRKISRIEEATKSLFVPGVFFEELGLRYIGPIPGNDIKELIMTLEGVKDFNRPVIVHVMTEKGCGYSPAEASPESFHGLPGFDPDTGKVNGTGGDGWSFSAAFGDAVCELAGEHEDIAVITAAMTAGTGLKKFSEEYPERFYDVGIAEEHAVVFAAGMAAAGLRPLVAIYSTFLQRALDCVFHDICLQGLPVIICTDRAGIVEDGPTHHGIHDLAFLRNMPNLDIIAPKNGAELRAMLFAAYARNKPVLIRYPKGDAVKEDAENSEISWGRAEAFGKGGDLSIWAIGKEFYTAKKVAEILKAEHKIEVTLVNVRFLKPFDAELLKEHALTMRIITLEDCQIQGGLGSVVDETLVNVSHKGVMHLGWGLNIVPYGDTCRIREEYGLTPEAIAEKCAGWMSQDKSA
ncbi:MAG: 1-deoxy-D-xylulose-5-phosphate synthase [Lentisphaerae bacterium GWF2_44_16]|nr:MAG: 1-deoxy-D-xylulose-5-phosphate synthase [Lentisphaerae bacterium GWF2_44_16]